MLTEHTQRLLIAELMATLESLIRYCPYPEVVREAEKRLKQLELIYNS